MRQRTDLRRAELAQESWIAWPEALSASPPTAAQYEDTT
jgi:hypothetical protein